MFSVQPIAFVHNERKEIKDDEWGDVRSYITFNGNVYRGKYTRD